ncbi:unnamed protein product [Blepharisma stoltei]|uniref:Ion transport domain-containing protein n=1 Tax=Blepharisma stoltei TaxID=1481888 RepID=A0AAU9JFJ1_9CILI|nr:unnamed protein product [Blepharisma stoltei]
MSLTARLLATSFYDDECQAGMEENVEMKDMSNDIQKHLGLKFTLGELLDCSAFSPDGKYLCFTTDTNVLYVIANIEERFWTAEIARSREIGRHPSIRSPSIIQNQQITPYTLGRRINIIKMRQDPKTNAYIIGCSGTKAITIFELNEGILTKIYEKTIEVSSAALEITEDMAILHNTNREIKKITYTKVNNVYDFDDDTIAFSVRDSTAISSFEGIIASGNSKGIIHRLRPDNDWPLEIAWDVHDGMPIRIWAISYYKTYIIAGYDNGFVYMYNDYITEIRKIKSFKAHDDVVRFIVPNPFSNYILTASRDATIKLWKIHKDCMKETYLHNSSSKGQEKHFRSINFSSNGINPEITIATRSGKVLKYLSPEYLDSETCLVENNEEIYHLCSHESNLISFARDKEIKVLENIREECENYNFTSSNSRLRQGGAITTDVPEKPMSISPDGSQLLYCADGRLIKADLHTSRVVQEPQIEDAVISIITYEDNGEFYAFTGHKGHWIRQWRINDITTPIAETKVHTSRVRCLALAKIEEKSPLDASPRSTKILFSGGKCTIIGYRIDQTDMMTRVKAHSKYINDLKVTNDCSLLISCSDDCLVLIWSINFSFGYNELSLAKLKQISYHQERVTSLLINDKHFMASSFDGKVSIWNISDFSLCLSLNFDEKCSSVVSLSNNSILAVAAGKKIIVLDNPVSTRKFLIFGERSKIRKFIKYIYSAYSSSPPEHDVEMDNFFIAKYHMNILHIYADRDLAEHLTLSLKADGPFSATIQNETPLSLSLKSRHRDCINAILDNINKRIIESPKTASYLEEKLDVLNEIGASSLDEFYTSIFIKRENEVEKFVTKYNRLPKIIYSETFVPLKRNFEEENKFTFGRHGTPIVFFVSAVQVNMIWTQTLIYFTYLTLLSLYFIFFNDTWGFLYLISGFNMILFLIEVAHMKVDFQAYAKDKWNYFDILRDLCMFVYVIIKEILEINDGYLGLLLITVVVLSWAKGISYFRVHKSTRYIVNLFSNVIKDMISFVIFLFFLDIAFVVIFIAIDFLEHNEIQSIGSYFISIYLLNYGDFNTDDYTTIKWVFCFFATLCNTLIMLNLCIAIIGNSFTKVQENRVIADQLEMIDIILECELLMVTRRDKGIKKYLQMCSAKDSKEGKQDKIEEMLDEMKGNLSKAIEELSGKTDKVVEGKQDIAELKEMVQALFRRQQSENAAEIRREHSIN